jgi:hypothetical protein
MKKFIYNSPKLTRIRQIRRNSKRVEHAFSPNDSRVFF